MTLNAQPILISFSGIDGSGKSTQIGRLSSHLLELGLSVKHLAFWDDVVVLPRLRAGISHKVLGGEAGIGEPGKPVKRNDKNARRWYLTLARSPFYLFDAISLRKVVRRERAYSPDVIIFDRYIYDQIAHIPDNPIGRCCRRLLLKLVPAPDVGFLLDADPEVATARKPEYPLEFVRKYRADYFGLRSLAPELTVVPSGSMDEVEHLIWRKLESRLRQPTSALDSSSRIQLGA